MSLTTLTSTSLNQQLETVYQIAHLTAGRIRFRVPRLADDADYADRLKQAIKIYPFVTGVSINLKAVSLTVSYRSSQVSDTVAQEKIIAAILQAQALQSLSYSTSDLAKRLGVTFQALNWRRSQVDFADWSRVRDPEGMTWRYDSTAKAFYPIQADSTTAQIPRFLQTLGYTTSEKVGGFVGKFAGEAIGLVLLGSTGVIIGAEVGALLGEVVGAELGNML